MRGIFGRPNTSPCPKTQGETKAIENLACKAALEHRKSIIEYQRLLVSLVSRRQGDELLRKGDVEGRQKNITNTIQYSCLSTGFVSGNKALEYHRVLVSFVSRRQGDGLLRKGDVEGRQTKHHKYYSIVLFIDENFSPTTRRHIIPKSRFGT